jgi:hypothetical protein
MLWCDSLEGQVRQDEVAHCNCLRNCAIAAPGLSFRTNMEVSMFGFPDGHITDY